MPRNVRNWWVELDVDGVRKANTGPVGRDGTIDVFLYARDHGAAINSFHIAGRVLNDGRLHLTVDGPDGREVAEHVTER
jgi:hypothetical protein